MSRDQAEHQLIQPHRDLYKGYWKWANDAMYSAIDRGYIRTRFGWTMRITSKTRFRTLLNWPIQAAGADILRMAAIGLVRNGIEVSALIHDAVLTLAQEDDVQEHVSLVQRIMRKAALVAIGYEIPVDSKVIRYPDRYSDARGTDMFNTIVQLLGEVEAERASSVKGGIGGIGGYTYKNFINRIYLDIPDILNTPDMADTLDRVWRSPCWRQTIATPDM